MVCFAGGKGNKSNAHVLIRTGFNRHKTIALLCINNTKWPATYACSNNKLATIYGWIVKHPIKIVWSHRINSFIIAVAIKVSLNNPFLAIWS